MMTVDVKAAASPLSMLGLTIKPRVRQLNKEGDGDKFLITVGHEGKTLSRVAQLSNLQRLLGQAGRKGEAWYMICKNVREMSREIGALQQ